MCRAMMVTAIGNAKIEKDIILALKEYADK